MEAAGVPTARTLPVARPPCVVKLDGLAAGKGVWVCRTQDELDSALEAAQAFDQPFHVEELLEGPELSLFAVAAGEAAVAFPPARDYKRIGDGDTGPNTGGMGSFSPLPDVADDEAEEILETVHLPVLRELARRGTPFQGLLYAGLMRTEDGLRVIEFNCRFGDPETQSLLPAARERPAAAARRRPLAAAGGCGSSRGHGRALGRRVSRARRPGHADRGSRGGRGDGRARLPRGDGAPRRAARHERRPHPERRRHRRDGRGRAKRGLRGGGAHRFRRHALPHATSPPMADGPRVGILVGSESDRERMQGATALLDEAGVGYEFEVRSAHRTPDAVAEYARSARDRGLRVLICGAGLSAALPGAVAAQTDLPVIGVPLRSSLSVLDGLDALLAIAQMPPGVPVAAVGVDNAKNAAALAPGSSTPDRLGSLQKHLPTDFAG